MADNNNSNSSTSGGLNKDNKVGEDPYSKVLAHNKDGETKAALKDSKDGAKCLQGIKEDLKADMVALKEDTGGLKEDMMDNNKDGMEERLNKDGETKATLKEDSKDGAKRL